ncbi:hypothetical protein [Niabella ginsengisoli]|uniref:Uncharacterized protein n=1 Tax=Niabella ginsengisoli TaxID=522298 RepID=A0ABS9SGA6_9BACT|nr:hypothetical protein [Niabella ginsengisoli]MCH5597393.1 hypothetical protein [Niabella ginsengisoli]
MGRYLTAKNLKESRVGLLMNGIVKVPMQFCILLLGVLVFSFYQFHKAPAFFNDYELTRLENSQYNDALDIQKEKLAHINDQKAVLLKGYAKTNSDEKLIGLKHLQDSVSLIRNDIKDLIKENGGSENDTNYIF